MAQIVHLKGASVEEVLVNATYLFQRGNFKVIQVRDTPCNISK